MSLDDDVAYVVQLGLQLVEEPRECLICHAILEKHRDEAGREMWICRRCRTVSSV